MVVPVLLMERTRDHSDRFTVEFRECAGDEALMILRGELDVGSADILDRALCEVESHQPQRLVLDLAGVDFIDSTGLAILVKALRRNATVDRRLVLRNLSTQATRLLQLTGMSAAFDVRDSNNAQSRVT